MNGNKDKCGTGSGMVHLPAGDDGEEVPGAELVELELDPEPDPDPEFEPLSAKAATGGPGNVYVIGGL